METNNITLEQLQIQKEAIEEQCKNLSQQNREAHSKLDNINDQIHQLKLEQNNNKNYELAIKHINNPFRNKQSNTYYTITKVTLLNHNRISVEYVSVIPDTLVINKQVNCDASCLYDIRYAISKTTHAINGHDFNKELEAISISQFKKIAEQTTFSIKSIISKIL